MTSRVLVALRVATSPERAFAAFTDEIGEWWKPNGLFALTPRAPGTLAFDRAGDRLIETRADGGIFEIGRVLAWEPGRRLAFTWRQATFATGQETRVEVRFEGVGDETRVSVEHAGWETVPQDHVARHRFPDGVFLQRLGEWWQVLLASLRRRIGEEP